MSWIKLSIDRYAKLESATGARLKNIDGVWWRRIRPFFYRPLFFDSKITVGSVRPPISPLIGGYQHLVHDPAQANSQMNFLVCKNDGSYSIQSLSRNYRKNIAKAQKTLIVKPIFDKDRFIHDAYPVYLSFYARTHYRYLNSRLRPERFAEWASILFSFPELLVLGAFRQDELEGVSITYQVERSVVYATHFSSDAGLKNRASELLFHSIREMAAQNEGIENIFLGMSGGPVKLDQFKTSRGCILDSRPAFLAINPAILMFLKRGWRNKYYKLIGSNNGREDITTNSSEH